MSAVGQSACLPACKCCEGCGFESHHCPLTAGPQSHRCSLTCLQTESKPGPQMAALPLRHPYFSVYGQRQTCNFNQYLTNKCRPRHITYNLDGRILWRVSTGQHHLLMQSTSGAEYLSKLSPSIILCFLYQQCTGQSDVIVVRYYP